MSKSFIKLFILFFAVVLVSSCDLLNNKNEDPKPEDKYLVTYQKQKAYIPGIIKPVLDAVGKNYPEIAMLKEKMEHGVSVYKISYITRFNGKDIIASGLVSIPETKGVTFPVLSYQNGTNTLHSNAPSVNPDDELYTLLEFVASAGFVIALPDYLGFGESDEMFHPYFDKVSTVQSVTDMLMAVKELATNYLDIELNNDLYIMGYSQGGWATMQLQKSLEEKPLDDFELKASACGASPFDLNTMNKHIIGLQTYPMPYFLGYVYHSFNKLGVVTNPPADLFKSPYAEKVMLLFDGKKSSTEINAELSTNISDLLNPAYITGAYTDAKYKPLVDAFTSNSIAGWKTTTPTMILHGSADDFVPPILSNKMFQEFLNSGVGTGKVTLVPLSGATHTTGIIPSGLASILWFIDLKNK